MNVASLRVPSSRRAGKLTGGRRAALWTQRPLGHPQGAGCPAGVRGDGCLCPQLLGRGSQETGVPAAALRARGAENRVSNAEQLRGGCVSGSPREAPPGTAPGFTPSPSFSSEACCTPGPSCPAPQWGEPPPLGRIRRGLSTTPAGLGARTRHYS